MYMYVHVLLRVQVVVMEGELSSLKTGWSEEWSGSAKAKMEQESSYICSNIDQSESLSVA